VFVCNENKWVIDAVLSQLDTRQPDLSDMVNRRIGGSATTRDCQSDGTDLSENDRFGFLLSVSGDEIL
jgi:hypothetical protein